MTAITPVAFATGSYNSGVPTVSFTGTFSKISDGTAYTPVAGDFIAVWIVHSGTATRTLAQVTPAAQIAGSPAYSPINASVITSSDTNILSAAGSYRFVTTETGIVFPSTAANTNSISWIALLFQNIDTTTPLAGVTPTTATAINGALPDCPSVTTASSPTGQVMVGFGGQAQSTGAALTAPTTTPFDATARYTGFVNNTAQTNDSAAGYGIKTGLGVSAAFNPSAFNGGTTANTDAMGALSFILKPSVNTFNDTLSESVTGSDSNVVIGTMNPAYNESLTASDSMAGGLLLTKTISESVTASDALANLVTWGPTLAESLTAVESMAALLTAVPAYNEALIASDSLAPNLVIPTSISEAVAAADSEAVAVTFNAPFTESLTADFALAAIATMVPTLSESVTATDALVGGFVYANSISESVTSADSLTAGAVYNASITESLTGAAGVSGARVTVLRL